MIISQILLELAVVLIVSQLLGSFCAFLRQPRVVGEILSGLILGPSLFGFLWPRLFHEIFTQDSLPILQIIGELGLIMYMFYVGLSFNINQPLKYTRYINKWAFITSFTSTALPLILGIPLGIMLYSSFAGPNSNLISFAAFIMSTPI